MSLPDMVLQIKQLHLTIHVIYYKRLWLGSKFGRLEILYT